MKAILDISFSDNDEKDLKKRIPLSVGLALNEGDQYFIKVGHCDTRQLVIDSKCYYMDGRFNRELNILCHEV